MSLGRYRIRLSLNPLADEPIVCRIQGGLPMVGRASPAYVEVGLYEDPATFIAAAPTGITKVVMNIAANNNRSGLSFVQKTVLAANMLTISEADWLTDAADKYHARFALEAADMTFDFTNASDNILTLWLGVRVELTGGDYVTFGGTLLKVQDQGGPAGGLGTTYGNFRITAGGEIQFVGKTTGKFYPPFVEDAVAGAEQVVVEEGES